MIIRMKKLKHRLQTRFREEITPIHISTKSNNNRKYVHKAHSKTCSSVSRQKQLFDTAWPAAARRRNSPAGRDQEMRATPYSLAGLCDFPNARFVSLPEELPAHSKHTYPTLMRLYVIFSLQGFFLHLTSYLYTLLPPLEYLCSQFFEAYLSFRPPAESHLSQIVTVFIPTHFYTSLIHCYYI